jgi:hypothetical protein
MYAKIGIWKMKNIDRRCSENAKIGFDELGLNAGHDILSTPTGIQSLENVA